MDPKIEQILDKLLWPGIALILFILFGIIFKEQIREFLKKLNFVKFSYGKFSTEFGLRVQEAKVRAKGVEDTVAASGIRPEARKEIDFSSQSERDTVLLSWGAVKQVVFDACAARKMPLTPATAVRDAVQRLAESGAINKDLHDLINVLNDLGKELAADTSVKPLKSDARTYIELAYAVVDWIMLYILSPKTAGAEGDSSPPPTPRQATVVGEYFPPPGKGSLLALLVGVTGPVQDRRFPVDKARYRIGRNPDNDLCITGDDFVSGNHACLNYENGRLFLFDEGSRNGTFLNEKRITGTPSTIRRGDRIRFGGSTFQVLETKTPPEGKQPDHGETHVL